MALGLGPAGSGLIVVFELPFSRPLSLLLGQLFISHTFPVRRLAKMQRGKERPGCDLTSLWRHQAHHW